MKKRRYARRFATLLMILLSLTIFTTSGSALAPDEEFWQYWAYCPYDTICQYEPLVEYDTYTNYESPSPLYSYIPEGYVIDEHSYPYQYGWQQNVTGSFYSLQILSTAQGIISGIITQYAGGPQFYAMSINFAIWEITGPVAYRGEYETPYLSPAETGIVRIERLPYHIEGRIVWVGFIVMGSGANLWREQIRIFLDGIWLNPLPGDSQSAIAGLEGFDWGREAIEFVVARDLMNMYLCTQTNELIAFQPAGNATRGHVLAAAVKALGLTAPYFEAAHAPFYDVKLAGHGIYIDIAKQLGLVVGIGDNYFAPDQTITRQDMMTMLYNIMMAMGQIQPDIGLTNLGRFNDFSEISSHARLPISSLAMAGIISGDGVSLNPRGYVTRVEAAMFVRNLYRVGE